MRLNNLGRRCLAVLLMSGGGAFGAPTLDAPALSDTGHFTLQWDAGDAAPTDVEVQQATTEDFTDASTIYEGKDEAATISGLLDGAYYYRVRSGPADWSEPAVVTVRHHSLGKAVFFLGLGAVVFLATAVLIIGGHRAHGSGRSSGGKA